MRDSLRKYLEIFSKIYPSRPAFDMFPVYERALDDVPDLDLEAACEIVLRECRFFPTPAEIRMRVKFPDLFVGTVNKSDCALCGGSGWKRIERADGAAFAVLCDCTKTVKTKASIA